LATITKIKIHQLAKELGVDSKVIVSKLQAEDIPGAAEMTHMSTIQIGLAATIREWFSGQGGAATAVETAQKVDIETVRKKPGVRKKTAAKKTDSEHDEGDSHVGDDPIGHAPPEHHISTPEVVAPVAKAPAPDPVRVEHARIEPAAPEPTQARTEPPRVEPVRAEPARPEPARTEPPHRAEPGKATEHRHAAKAPDAPPSRDHGERGERGEHGDHGRPASPARPSSPARPHPPARQGASPTMNVPSRPTVVAPAGPRMQAPTAVRLSGPKVVRIEAPEQIQAPRPRRVGPPMGPGPSGPRPGGGPAEDDRGRSPRRKESGAGAAGARRSSGQGVPDRRRGRSGADWVGQPQGIYSEKDLIEREERLARAGGFLKKRQQDLKKPGQHGPATAGPLEGKVRIAAPFTIKELSAVTGVKGADIVKKLFLQGVMMKINDPIAGEKAIEIMMEFDIDLEVTEAKTAEETVSDQFAKRDVKDLRSRGPVVTILGHVDHGKTSLLDKIRNANVAAGEAGGITQKTSAFVAEVDVEGRRKQIVFLDTPGHEAFTSMRARGAKMTDVVVLVVSAPEGVMPQTIESINHTKAAKVPMVVALNKMDRPDATEAQIQKTLGELAAAGVNPVEWGGDTEVVRVSAVTGLGIQQLLETLDYQSQLLELKADFDGPAQGTVVEAKVEEGRGAVANILIQQGQLKVGDFAVLGRAFGRIRDITDDKGVRIKVAVPPMPVQVSGVDLVCDAGDKFYVTRSLKEAEEAADQRRQRERHAQLAAPKLTLDSLFSQMQEQQTEAKEIRLILKTDQQGTVDVLKGECEKIKTAEVKTRVLHAAVGGIQESDVTLADASKAIIIGFNVIPSGKARQLAEQKGVEIRTYQVIYDITDDLKKAAEGMLAPDVREELLGHAEVRAVFKVTKVGNIAGCYVTDGTVQRDALIRVTRNGVVIEHDRKLAQLKRVKDDAKEVRAGMECGMKIDGYDDIKEGDILECYRKVEVKRTL